MFDKLALDKFALARFALRNIVCSKSALDRFALARFVSKKHRIQEQLWNPNNITSSK